MIRLNIPLHGSYIKCIKFEIKFTSVDVGQLFLFLFFFFWSALIGKYNLLYSLKSCGLNETRL